MVESSSTEILFLEGCVAVDLLKNCHFFKTLRTTNETLFTSIFFGMEEEIADRFLKTWAREPKLFYMPLEESEKVSF